MTPLIRHSIWNIIVALMASLHISIMIYLGHKNGLDEEYGGLDSLCVLSIHESEV